MHRLASLILALLFIMPAALGQESPTALKPLDKDQIMRLLDLGMDEARLARQVREHGIDFAPTDDYLKALRELGARGELIQALREQRPGPLSKEQLIQLLIGGVPSQRVQMLVKQHGLDFVADEKYLQTILVAGADDPLVSAVREESKMARARVSITTQAGAEIFLDGESQGKADEHGKLEIMAKPGTHELRASAKEMIDFQRRIMLGPAEQAEIRARPEHLPGAEKYNRKDDLSYIWIPHGKFMMGCSPGDSECSPDEKPLHEVTISKGFWLGATPVMTDRYAKYAKAKGRKMPGAPPYNRDWEYGQMPIMNVSWYDAADFCSWAGGRLPTEAEWEYAARAGSTLARYGPIEEVAVYTGNSSHQEAEGVRGKLENVFKLYDMLGNVWEWVNDWYGKDYYANSPARDPQGPESGKERVVRGGSFMSPAARVRASARGFGEANYHETISVGFRCAIDAENF